MSAWGKFYFFWVLKVVCGVVWCGMDDDVYFAQMPLDIEHYRYPGTNTTNLMVMIAKRELKILVPRLQYLSLTPNTALHIVNLQNKMGNTALHYAINNIQDLLVMLISTNGPKEVLDSEYVQELFNIVWMLMDLGANPWTPNSEGRTPNSEGMTPMGLLLHVETLYTVERISEIILYIYLNLFPVDIMNSVIQYLLPDDIFGLKERSKTLASKYFTNDNPIWKTLWVENIGKLPQMYEHQNIWKEYLTVMDTFGNIDMNNNNINLLITEHYNVLAKKWLNAYKLDPVKYTVENLNQWLNSAVGFKNYEFVEILIELGANNIDNAIEIILTNKDLDVDGINTVKNMITSKPVSFNSLLKKLIDILKPIPPAYSKTTDNQIYNGILDLLEICIKNTTIDLNNILIAATYKKNADLINLLISAGATNLNAALLIASSNNDIHTTNLLLQAGATY